MRRSEFRNISNHPSAKWPEEQRRAALADHAVIRDTIFPPIDPAWTSAEVEALALDFVESLDIGDPEQVTVHIMGEMTFTFACVRILQSRGVRCVASTTERIVEENGTEKRTVFHFRQFREYPK